MNKELYKISVRLDSINIKYFENRYFIGDHIVNGARESFAPVDGLTLFFGSRYDSSNPSFRLEAVLKFLRRFKNIEVVYDFDRITIFEKSDAIYYKNACAEVHQMQERFNNFRHLLAIEYGIKNVSA